MVRCTKCHLLRDAKAFATKAKGRRQSWCRACIKRYDAERYQRIKPQRYAQVKIRHREIRDWVWSLKRGPCTDCGGRFHPVAMQWDHLGTDKTANVANLVQQGCGRERIVSWFAPIVMRCVVTNDGIKCWWMHPAPGTQKPRFNPSYPDAVLQ